MGRRSSTKAPTNRKKPSLIGDDPLAWMKEEADSSPGDEQSRDRHEDDEVQSEVGGSGQVENQQGTAPQNEPPIQEPSAERIQGDEPENVAEPQASLVNGQQEQGDTLTIALESELDIAMVRGLYERLQALLEQSGQVVLDAGSVQMIDAAALQTLAAFIQAAGARGIDTQWKDVSAKMHEAASLLGLQGHLRL